MVKLAGNRLRLRSGKIAQFGSEQARANFEKVAQAIKSNPDFLKKIKGSQRLGKI